MKKVIVIALAIAVIAGGFLAVYLSSLSTESPEPSSTDPFGTLTNPGQMPPQQILYLEDGSQVVVPDFIPANQPEWANAEYGYRVTQDEEERYSLIFYPNESGFLISLATEPLGEMRRIAETDLMQRLQLSKAQMCNLNVQVFTSISVNETYAGQNLGISFCPEAVQLPG